MDDIIDWNELVPVAQFAESFVLLVHESQRDDPRAMAVQVNLGRRVFSEVMEIGHFLKFNPFEQVNHEDINVRFMYHDIIMRKFTKEAILAMNIDFTNKLYNE